MLEIAKKYPGDMSQDFIADSSEYTINNTFSSVRENILNWYPFKKDCTILEIGAGMGSLTGLLCDKAKKVTSVEMNSVRAKVIKARYAERKNLDVIVQNIEKLDKALKFDYVIMIGVLEYSDVFFDVKEPFKYMLELAKSHLNKNGIILCAIENRFGLKYWCGASEDHLQQPFIGINGYGKDKTPKTLSKNALSELFDSAGFLDKRFYYVLPDYRFPKAIYTDDYLPVPQDIDNIPFTYSKGSLLHTKEQTLYSEIIKNHTFDFFANSYLIEAGIKKINDYKINFVSARGEARKEYRCFTIIDNKNKVIKYPAHLKSENHIRNVYSNYLYLKRRGIKQIDQYYKKNRLYMDFVFHKRADLIFEEALVANDLKPIYSLIDKLKENLLKSSDFETEKNILVDLGYFNKGEYNGAILKYGFIDMTFYNAFIVDNELVFFDQEWKIENIPLNFMLYYAIKIAYTRAKTKHEININDLLHYAGVMEYFDEFDKLESYIWSLVLYRTDDVYGKDGYCNQYSDNITLKYKIDQFDQDLKNKQAHVEQLKGELQNKTEHVEQLKGELQNKTEHVEQLIMSERRLTNDINGILTSRTYKLASKISSISRKIFPIYSKRRFFAKLIYKFLSHPIKFITKISPKRIGLFFHVLKTEGTPGVSRRVNNHMINKEIPQYIQEFNIIKNSNTLKVITDYDPVVFIKEEKPVVSIVIPVYNQFDYTYNCLKSISQYSGSKIGYEIIIANDCSDDITTQINEVISNINVITTDINLRFLKNCNNAAKQAKGKYILFLNNDTQVQDNWLSPLVELIEKDEKIGAVGSKLVYENGMLQEAGGILWNDASAWNYGRMDDPALPEYNYVKEVDYISGAALMVKKSIWDKLGGFDENFSPAYCEDSDICFSIRKMGYKVMYQPASVIVHFEGITNGTDISEGQKQYQAINQNKFYEKWKVILENEHYLNGKNVFLARDRSRKKKTLLMVDHYVPHFDKDAGSRAVFQYLKLFADMGFNVKFIGDNFFKHEPYTAILEQMGIEVLYGPYYAQNWKRWLETNGMYINYIFLSRPHISVKYIDEVKKFTKAKVFYYGHDLHFLRDSREYNISKDKTKLKSSKKWKEVELSLMKKSDVVYYFSNEEIKIIKEINPSINCKVIPLNIFPKNKLHNYDYNKRKDIIFVGGFSHEPNVDGLIWFVQNIMPLVRKSIPDIILYVIGSNVTEKIKILENENVKILGYLDDNTLNAYYKKCKVCIVPLRYGAGVKGKLLEAMYNQIPVITTNIGAEGLPDIEKCLIIEDTPENFAGKLINMYNDNKLLETLVENSHNYIMNNFTIDNTLNILKKDFNIKSKDS
jgi:GT2 family glycosyltransferase/2-polyprenyl-3-methyl-5-hydroxy-6-metoxy-1,4-benzoquinol methylase